MKILRNYPLELLQLMLICKNHTSEVNLVGGCVRDMLLNKQPKDFDVVINGELEAITNELKDNGWKIDEAGLNFLVTIASRNGHQFEIAMYRKDGTYTDGRRPDSVEVGTITDDAIRRDFTINSLYFDPFTDTLLDPTTKGLKDIEERVIRFNGKAKDRIQEDYLRIMRCYRFAAQLGFEIESKALKACRTYFDHMCKTIPSERIKIEVEKMI
jgi:tRNA nucleotidyltransferase/poly(A) polymerase